MREWARRRRVRTPTPRRDARAAVAPLRRRAPPRQDRRPVVAAVRQRRSGSRSTTSTMRSSAPRGFMPRWSARCTAIPPTGRAGPPIASFGCAILTATWSCLRAPTASCRGPMRAWADAILSTATRFREGGGAVSPPPFPRVRSSARSCARRFRPRPPVPASRGGYAERRAPSWASTSWRCRATASARARAGRGLPWHRG